MSLYPSDGEMYAGWSTGRWFGLAGVFALAFALLGRGMTHGWLAPSLTMSSQMLAVFLEYVGGGLFFLMASAVAGSLTISWKDRGDVEVTAAGVRRIFRPGRELFLPLEEIAGLVPQARSDVVLVSTRSRKTMVVPRSIVSYRECIAEIEAMGVERLPMSEAWRAEQGLTFKTMTWKERVQTTVAYAGATFCFLGHMAGEYWIGGVLCAGMFAWMALDHRRNPARRVWIAPAAMSATYAVIFIVARVLQRS